MTQADHDRRVDYIEFGATDMGGAGGRPIAAGAASVVWAATLPDEGPTGGFFRDGRPLKW